MRKKLMLAMLVIFIACAATTRGFKEPTSDKSMLVIGNIIFENKYYNNQQETIRRDIEVAIVGKHDADGKDHAYWLTTDENGFFCLADVPPGKYALQGIRVYLGQGELLTISNPLEHSGSYYKIQRKPYVVFQADYFPIETQSRIYNLGYNHFWIDISTRASAQVEHRVYDYVKDLPLVNGNRLTLPPIAQYFMEKYPQSSWVPLLKAEL